jgi:hypothetical protein
MNTFNLHFSYNFIYYKIRTKLKSKKNYYIYEDNEWKNINFKVFLIKYSCTEYIVPKNYLCEFDNNYIFVYTTLNNLPNIDFTHHDDLKFYKNVKYRRFINNNFIDVVVSENDLNKFVYYSTHKHANTNLDLILNNYFNYDIDFIEYDNVSKHIQHAKFEELIE